MNTVLAPTAKLAALAAVAACDVSAVSGGGGAPASPSSPSRGGNRVGGENIAALRERMSQIQIAYNSQQTRRAAATKAAAAAEVDGEAAAAAAAGFSPLSASEELTSAATPNAALATGGLEAIQRRIRDLSAGGVA